VDAAVGFHRREAEVGDSTVVRVCRVDRELDAAHEPFVGSNRTERATLGYDASRRYNDFRDLSQTTDRVKNQAEHRKEDDTSRHSWLLSDT
jgi:hypothetical protein